MANTPILSIIAADGVGGNRLQRVLEHLSDEMRGAIEVIAFSAGGLASGRADASMVWLDPASVREHPRLAALRAARGWYVMFVEAGDRLSPDHCRVLTACAEWTGADIVAGTTVFESDGRLVDYSPAERAALSEEFRGREILAAFLDSMGVLPSWLTLRGKIFSRELCRKAIQSIEELAEPLALDCDFALLLPLFARASHLHAARTCGHYIVGPGNSPLFRGDCGRGGDAARTAMAAEKALNFAEAFIGTLGEKRETIDPFRAAYAGWLAGAGRPGGAKAADVRRMAARFGGDAEKAIPAAECIGFFHGNVTEYRGVVENSLKPLFRDDAIRCVSFDLFDTLLSRPFYLPEDLFLLLDKTAESLMKNNTPFHQIRREAEEAAGKHRQEGGEGVTLDAIYATIERSHRIAPEILASLKAEELRLVSRCCGPRRSAREIFELAKALGKRLIVVSDTCLDSATVGPMLDCNGFAGYDALFLSCESGATKRTGGLYRRMLAELAVRPEEIIHIGGDRRDDYDMPRSLGMRAFHFPHAVDAMRDAGGACLDVALRAMPPTMRKDFPLASAGCRTAVALAANRYFDDPFRDFRDGTDFNADPFLIGYYPLGMHLLGLGKWVGEVSEARGYKTVHYNARDGYLPMLFHRRLGKAGVIAAGCDYVYGSRTMLLPALVEGDRDFRRFIRFGDATPRFFLERFAFCLRPGDAPAILAGKGIDIDRRIIDDREVDRFLAVFLEELFDRQRLAEARRALRRYYDNLLRGENSAFFDVGYNGSNPSAISSLTGKRINVLYIHKDRVEDAQRVHGFALDCFYPFTPAVSGALREHLLSESGPPCIGMADRGGESAPVFGPDTSNPAENLVAAAVRRGALAFLDDYLAWFSDYFPNLPFTPFEMSLPLEGYLHFPRRADLTPFSPVEFDNFFHLGGKTINLHEYSLQCAVRFSPFVHACPKADPSDAESLFPAVCTVGTLGQHMQAKSNAEKFIAYCVLDRRLLAEILRARADRSGVIMRMGARCVARLLEMFS